MFHVLSDSSAETRIMMPGRQASEEAPNSHEWLPKGPKKLDSPWGRIYYDLRPVDFRITKLLPRGSEEGAIRTANDSKYGLGASLWTKDKRKGVQMAQRINAASAGVDAMAVSYGAPEAPAVRNVVA